MEIYDGDNVGVLLVCGFGLGVEYRQDWLMSQLHVTVGPFVIEICW